MPDARVSVLARREPLQAHFQERHRSPDSTPNPPAVGSDNNSAQRLRAAFAKESHLSVALRTLLLLKVKSNEYCGAGHEVAVGGQVPDLRDKQPKAALLTLPNLSGKRLSASVKTDHVILDPLPECSRITRSVHLSSDTISLAARLRLVTASPA
jgi:hypothetical protein